MAPAAHRRVRADRPLLRAAGQRLPGRRRPQERQRLPAGDARHDLVVKTDTVVVGRAFPCRREARAGCGARRCASACPISRRAARRRTSTSSRCRCRRRWTERWVADFARGLAADQRRFGIVLCGGDTVGTPGPPTITITAFGACRARQGADARRRAGRGRALGSAARSATLRSACWRPVAGSTSAALRSAIACRSRARPWGRAWSASPMPSPMSPTGCWPMPATSPRPRGLRVRIERERVPLSRGGPGACCGRACALGQCAGRRRRLRTGDRRTATQGSGAARGGARGKDQSHRYRRLHARQRRRAHGRRPAGARAAQGLCSLLVSSFRRDGHQQT